MWRNIVCLQFSGTLTSRRPISSGSGFGIAQPSGKFVPAVWCTETAEMIIRLGRLTPGYFRLLQRQVAGEIQAPAHDRSVNQIAMMLAIMGLSMSYYSAKQMTEKVRHEPVQ